MGKLYRTELHCHTRTVSPCANADPEYLIEDYKKHGYDTIVVTDHFKTHALHESAYLDAVHEGRFVPDGFDRSIFARSRMGTMTWDDIVSFFVSGAQYLRQIAPPEMTILQSAELCMPGAGNDYLLYGITEEFLRAHPGLDRITNLITLHNLLSANGILLIEAHPFRNGMAVMDPSWVDGIEVYNGAKNHNSRNEVAEFWADHYSLIKTSGTDYHDPCHTPDAGILTEEKITSVSQLVRILKSGEYDLIRE